MINTVQDFEEEIAWERTTLERVVPLANLSSKGVDLDLRNRGITIYLPSIVTGAEETEALRRSILPLCFGAAWKILDITAELALALGGQQPKKGRRWTIEEKVQQVASQGSLPGFPKQDIWRGTWALYGATKEMRHALVHRRVSVDSSGTLTGVSEQGATLTPITIDDQSLIVRVATRLVDVVVKGTLHSRQAADLRTQLQRLVALHREQIEQVKEVHQPIRVRGNFPSDGKLDVPAFWAEIRKAFRAASYVDLELELTGGRMVVITLDQAPKEIVSVDLHKPPEWCVLKG